MCTTPCTTAAEWRSQQQLKNILRKGKTKAKTPSSGDCVNRLAHFHLRDGGEVANQVAAPAETRTPNLHRAKIAHRECGWKGGDSGNSAREKTLSKRKPKRIHLTPTGLLMEGHFTQNPG